MMKKISSAFTLIELLVVISIIGILIALSIFGLEGARRSSRDARRKADLELIRSGLEIYKSDCNLYPLSSTFTLTPGNPLLGSGNTSSCSSSNTYISQIPGDPVTTQRYSYTSADGNSYILCASLESGGAKIDECGDCGSGACNLKVTNP